MRKGLTIIEVMIATGISVLLLAAVMMSSMQMQAMFYTTDVTSNLQTQGRLALNRLAADLRRTDAQDIITPQAHQISITQNSPVGGTDTITYQLPQDTSPIDGEPDIDANGNIIWSGTDIMVRVDTSERRVVRSEAGVATSLASNVEKINFIDHSIDGSILLDNLKITLELSKVTPAGRTVTVESTMIVDLRN
jgi:type II secretory pathway pseudopilin PulG